MRVFGIAGFKNSGKTTLIVALLRILTGRGFKVATIKHAHHRFDIDHPGKDSYRHRDAGAEEVIVSSQRRWAHIRELGDQPEPPLDEFLGRIGPVDLVLIEGFKHSAQLKLEVRCSGSKEPMLAESDQNVCAIVSDAPLANSSVPVLDRADVDGIADFILQQLGLDSELELS